MRRGNLIAVTALLACSVTAATASTIIFQTNPPDGLLSGAAGATVGYGYRIVNLDPTLWLVTTGLSAGTLAYAAGTSLFDFPVVGPGETAFLPYDPSASTGLYEIAIDAASPLGYVNSGAFVLSADFYTLDPSLGGVLFAAAEDQIAEYQITAAPDTEVPEPRLLWTTGLGLAVLLWGASVGRRGSGKPAAM